MVAKSKWVITKIHGVNEEKKLFQSKTGSKSIKFGKGHLSSGAPALSWQWRDSLGERNRECMLVCGMSSSPWYGGESERRHYIQSRWRWEAKEGSRERV